ncbi:DUF1836 domain-containing protein [Companilactobacillus keshanensis]|uniref:DUF1836 domain-containing protein n=1 Tax=Companilactobacillus keshanensis TaxID=2486003 RepID=A0ABW4BSB1_9LACO|nr:DUF1836 domain-containing protein [Companilactobacillus keshanensis]
MDELQEWLDNLEKFKLPRWNDLPELDLYRDQLLTLIEKYLSPIWIEDGPIVTSSMVNNYVKNGLLPRPIKKRYTKDHLAYLIAITFLKQVISMNEIKSGLEVMTSLNGGIEKAFDFFCEKQELAFRMLNYRNEKQKISEDNSTSAYLMVEMVTLSFATKWMTRKVLMIENGALEEESKE